MQALNKTTAIQIPIRFPKCNGPLRFQNLPAHSGETGAAKLNEFGSIHNPLNLVEGDGVVTAIDAGCPGSCGRRFWSRCRHRAPGVGSSCGRSAGVGEAADPTVYPAEG